MHPDGADVDGDHVRRFQSRRQVARGDGRRSSGACWWLVRWIWRCSSDRNRDTTILLRDATTVASRCRLRSGQGKPGGAVTHARYDIARNRWPHGLLDTDWPRRADPDLQGRCRRLPQRSSSTSARLCPTASSLPVNSESPVPSTLWTAAADGARATQ
jgi:hypothetical protein